jgi:gamma-glutamyltranspeptidase/glutathione hydrolase
MAALTLLAPSDAATTTQEWLDGYAAAQRDVFQFRLDRLGAADDRITAVEDLLLAATAGDMSLLRGSPSTTHCSAVDTSGLACAITMSAGYGSGAMPAGMWMNNSLGEIELAGQDPHGVEPGTRMVSNMAPTVARHRDGSILAIGSPGADRITTAIATTLLRYTDQDMTLQEAVDAPRIHVEMGDVVSASAEPGAEPSNMPVKPYGRHSMYFGGVQAASWHPDRGFEGAADPRRTGGIAVG